MRRVTLAVLSTAALAAAGLTGSAGAKEVAGTVVNPGFEADGGVATPSGWRDVGDDGASFVESGGHTGSWRLSHWSPDDYAVVTTQTVDRLQTTTGTHSARGPAAARARTRARSRSHAVARR